MTQVDPGIRTVARHIRTSAFWRGFAKGATSPKARAGFKRNFSSAAFIGTLGSLIAFRRAQYVAALDHRHLTTEGELGACLVGSIGAVVLLRAFEHGWRRFRSSRAA